MWNLLYKRGHTVPEGLNNIADQILDNLGSEENGKDENE